MKKKLTGIIAAVAALALGASLLAGCGGSGGSGSTGAQDGSTRTVEDIQADGKIVIGVFSDKNPFGYVDENGEYQGYDIELARQIGTDLGVDVEFVSTEAANRVEYLKTNKVDLILANFTVTPERAEAVDFCEPYMNVALGAVSHKSHVITSLDELGEWGRAVNIFGLGGTDFRPAFAYVDKLVEDGEFENLGGLIYFTDGWGSYPEWMPSYKVAFVFYDEDYRPEIVPTWAAQIVLDENGVLNGGRQEAA